MARITYRLMPVAVTAAGNKAVCFHTALLPAAVAAAGVSQYVIPLLAGPDRAVPAAINASI